MSRPPSWIQAVEPQLKEALELPENPFTFSFPLDELSEFMASKLGISSLQLEISEKGWRTREAFFTGLGSSPISISLQASPLKGEVFWVMGYEDVRTFVSWIKEIELDNPEVVKGIYRYAILVTLEGLSQKEPLQDFSLKLTKDVQFEDKGYAVDVALKRGDEQIWGRVILSPSIKESFMNFFSKERLSFFDLAKQFPHLKIPLSIVNGSIELSQEELKSLKEGDFVTLEDAYFRPSDEKGSLKILLEGKPLLQIKYKEGKFKILDFIYAYEEVVADA